MAIEYRDGVEGKVCHRCGQWKPVAEFHRFKLTRDGYKASCKACMNASLRARRADDPEMARRKARAYMASRREQSNEYQRAWRALHRDKVLAALHRYKETHRELTRERYRQSRQARLAHHREIGRRAYHNNVEKRRAYNRAYKATHREKGRAHVRARRNLKYQAEGSHSEAEWQALKQRYDYMCLRCGKREPEIVLTRDHVVPLTRGGSDWISNIQPLCHSCNSSKNNKTIDYRPSWEA